MISDGAIAAKGICVPAEWNPVRMGADEEPVVEPLRTRSAAEDNSNQLAPIQKLQEKLAPMPSTGRTQELFFESADTAAT